MTTFEFDRPLIETERLELWLPRPGDRHAQHAIVSQPDTARYLGPQEASHQFAARFMRGAGSWFLFRYGFCMLRLRGEDAVIGNCGVFHTFRGLGDDFDDQPEAGWIVAAEHAGQGLGREAMDAVLAWFDRVHGPRRIVCMISPGNAPSFALAARLGFVANRDAALPDGDPVTLLERIP